MRSSGAPHANEVRSEDYEQTLVLANLPPLIEVSKQVKEPNILEEIVGPFAAEEYKKETYVEKQQKLVEASTMHQLLRHKLKVNLLLLQKNPVEVVSHGDIGFGIRQQKFDSN